MRLVVALGGNALLRRGEPAEASIQRQRVLDVASALAALAREHELVLTHGNGPQVGLLALEAAAYEDIAPYPLDVLGAESQGLIGYLLAQELQNHLPDRDVAVVLTQVLVDADDRAFDNPSKPIGPVYNEEEATRQAGLHGWTIGRDGASWRRVVPSPEPRGIVEFDSIRRLLTGRTVIVCAGGGGIPVIRDEGRLRGVEAVIDKDLTAALLAERIGADRLVIATDVAGVVRHWGRADAELIGKTSPEELRGLSFAAGSMGPKVEAACRFVERTGSSASIGALDDLANVAAARAGTQILCTSPASALRPSPDSLALSGL